MRLLATPLLLALLTGAAHAQNPPPVMPGKIGFAVGGKGGSAGDFCSGFQCTPHDLNITRGETLTLSYRTTPNAPWVLVIGPAPLPTCVTLPGILNQWAGPNILVATGTINQPDLIRCWGGQATTTIPVPTNIQIGAKAVFQVVADNGMLGAAFSSPVRVTVVL